MENHHAINGKINYKSPFSIAMLNYQRVNDSAFGDPPFQEIRRHGRVGVGVSRWLMAGWSAMRRRKVGHGSLDNDHYDCCILLVVYLPTPLKMMEWVRQLGWWNSQYSIWKNKKCSKPPTRLWLLLITPCFSFRGAGHFWFQPLPNCFLLIPPSQSEQTWPEIMYDHSLSFTMIQVIISLVVISLCSSIMASKAP